MGTAGPSELQISDLNCETAGPQPRGQISALQISLRAAGPQPRAADLSRHCRTSTASSRSQWAHELFSELMNQWTNESESMKESMNRWIMERMDQWTNHQWTKMNGWMDGWVGDLFAAAPLLSATSSLSSHLSGLLLLWAASHVASATQFFSLRSCYNALGNLHLQSRIPQD